MFRFIFFTLCLSTCALGALYENASSGGGFITLEEHYVPSVLRSYEQTNQVECLNAEVQSISLPSRLGDISNRLREMDETGIEMQILSINPNPYVLDKPELTAVANKELHDVTVSHPRRFKGLCMLPMAMPQRAADELRVCIEDYGFVGALVDNHLANGTFYDGIEYEVFWSMVEHLDVPIYIHPTFPSLALADVANGNFYPSQESYSLQSAAVLSTAGWGWHSETGIHFLRLWLGGVFDRHPDLKIIVGHMGEMLPYMLGRVNTTLGRTKSQGMSIYAAYARNLWLTTSGFFDTAPFLTMRNVTAPDRIMFSIDYPYATMEAGASFMAQLRDSGLLSAEEWNAIGHRNAKSLFKMG